MKHNFAHELSPAESLAADLEKRAFSGVWWDHDAWLCFRRPLVAEEEAQREYEVAVTLACRDISHRYDEALLPLSERLFDEAFDEVLSLADELASSSIEDLSEDRLEEWRADFVRGWEEAGGLTADLEAGSPRPWRCPWLWKAGWDWDRETRWSGRKAGELWWDEVEDEVLRAQKAEDEEE